MIRHKQPNDSPTDSSGPPRSSTPQALTIQPYQGRSSHKYPLIYQINFRMLLNETIPSPAVRSQKSVRLDDLDKVPEFLDSFLYKKSGKPFGVKYDYIYLLGVWQTGEASRQVSRTSSTERSSYEKLLPDYTTEDICGSPFAIQSYVLNKDFGTPSSLVEFRSKLHQRGIGMILDFVGNHTALDHPWVTSHPEYYIQGTEDLLHSQPQNYTQINGKIFAHGRDPYFDGWQDTLQLNYRHAGLRKAMLEELLTVASQCDGARCDMAMLLNPDTFGETWGTLSKPSDHSDPVDTPFWVEAIQCVKQKFPHFIFIAEVYWDKEWELQKMGFDYTYDKKLYDLLRKVQPWNVRNHLRAEIKFQDQSVRFLENHDELRAAAAFSFEQHQASAVLTFLAPGLRFFHEGQISGRTIKVSMHLQRRQPEKKNVAIDAFYVRLLEKVLVRDVVRNGSWNLLDVWEGWQGNISHNNLICYLWMPPPQQLSSSTERSLRRSPSMEELLLQAADPVLVVINAGPWKSQGYISLRPLHETIANHLVVLKDLMHDDIEFHRHGNEIRDGGLFFDMEPWFYHIFPVKTKKY